MKRLLVVLCLVVAAFGGSSLGMGHGTALADGTGAGNANACAQHATNNGNSYGYGLDCTSLTATITGVYPGSGGSACSLLVTGTGLQPGSGIFYSAPGFPYHRALVDGNGNPIVVSQNGTVNVTTFFGRFPGTITLDTTSAAGTPITTTFVPSC